MALIAFDTLKYASRLEKSGFERKQAAELAEAQLEVLSDLMQEKLVTKEDLQETKIALQSDIQEFKTELQAQIQEVRTELQAQIHQLTLQFKETQNTLVRWMAVLIAGGVGILSFLITALKLFL